VRKADGARLATRLGAKGSAANAPSSLADAQIEALTALLLRIERYYGAPQDVEWCHDDERFWIVQSRPGDYGWNVEGARAGVDASQPRRGVAGSDVASGSRCNRGNAQPRLFDASWGRLIAPNQFLGRWSKRSTDGCISTCRNSVTCSP